MVVSNSVVRRACIRLNSILHESFTAALFATLYKYWLTAPVLQFVSIGHWRVLAILVAMACGATLSLMGVATPTLSCGVAFGLLAAGTVAAWTAPNDVAVSLHGAFANHLESFWREILILIAAATLAALCCNYLREHLRDSKQKRPGA